MATTARCAKLLSILSSAGSAEGTEKGSVEQPKLPFARTRPPKPTLCRSVFVSVDLASIDPYAFFADRLKRPGVASSKTWMLSSTFRRRQSETLMFAGPAIGHEANAGEPDDHHGPTRGLGDSSDPHFVRYRLSATSLPRWR